MCQAEVRALHGDCVVDRSGLGAVTIATSAHATGAEACEGGQPLEAVASPVKSTPGATIWTELPDLSVTYSAVLSAESDAMMT